MPNTLSVFGWVYDKFSYLSVLIFYVFLFYVDCCFWLLFLGQYARNGESNFPLKNGEGQEVTRIWEFFYLDYGFPAMNVGFEYSRASLTGTDKSEEAKRWVKDGGNLLFCLMCIRSLIRLMMCIYCFDLQPNRTGDWKLQGINNYSKGKSGIYKLVILCFMWLC